MMSICSSHAFLVKDLGTLSYFLGVEVDHSSVGFFFSHRQHINDLLLKSNMLLAKLISTPKAASLKLSNFDATNFEDGTLYCRIIGGLQYLSPTRLYISFAINKLYQFMHLPKALHWIDVKRVLQYLKGTINLGLFFKK